MCFLSLVQWMIQTTLRLYYRTVFWVWDLKRNWFQAIFFMSFSRTFTFSREKKFSFLPNNFLCKVLFSQPIHCHSNMRAHMFSLNISTPLENKCLISQQEVRRVRLREHPTDKGRRVQWSFYLHVEATPSPWQLFGDLHFIPITSNGVNLQVAPN